MVSGTIRGQMSFDGVRHHANTFVPHARTLRPVNAKKDLINIRARYFDFAQLTLQLKFITD